MIYTIYLFDLNFEFSSEIKNLLILLEFSTIFFLCS